MSDTANTANPMNSRASDSSRREGSTAVETPERVVVVEEDNASPTVGAESDPARRRRRRRRRRSVRTESTERRLRFFLLGTVVLLIAVALTGGELRKSFSGVTDFLRPYIPIASIKSMMRLEIFALIIAALILLYLMPGVEDKILRTLGIKKDRRR
jgi:hypothetical protein